MAYLRRNICEEITVFPYDNSRNTLDVTSEYTLDYIWNEYNEKYHEAQIVPELKKIYVPVELFSSLGISEWFAFSFPNCLIEFW